MGPPSDNDGGGGILAVSKAANICPIGPVQRDALIAGVSGGNDYLHGDTGGLGSVAVAGACFLAQQEPCTQ